VAKVSNTSFAYDLSRFEAQTAERRTHIEAVKTVKSNTGVKAAPRISPLKAIACMLLVIGVASALLYTRVLLTERISDVTKATAEYTKLEAEGTRMTLELEGKVSLKNAEEYAATQLGMVKKDSKNVEYIRLTQENKIEVPEDMTPGFWDSVKEFFANLLS
jgi:homoaconitase/3-isopropylmalate dehydratase large subunit